MCPQVWTRLWRTSMMGRLVKTFRFASSTQPCHHRHRAPAGVGRAAVTGFTNHADQESVVPDAANTKWLSALDVLSSSGELGQGKMSMIRMMISSTRPP